MGIIRRATTDKQLLLLELNEVNFDFVQAYIDAGNLPHMRELVARHGFSRTTSEDRYEQLEPWIQWVTAHTGLSFAEHGVFRLGDIVSRDIPQIWEFLEARGMKVGAISPMNAKHRLQHPAFFVPDPWTRTRVSAGLILRNLHRALSQVVNENATNRLDASSAFALVIGAAFYARLRNSRLYAQYAARSLKYRWSRALFLDLLLSDIFIREVARTRVSFATLFLNAAAHLQHHYMFSARPYTGPHRNPSWYLAEGIDPVYEIYKMYDRIVGEIRRLFPKARLMIATGLHQVPHEHATYYWRLNDHAAFLRHAGIEFASVEPRMSRDFLVRCSSEASARMAQSRLRQIVHQDGTPLFEVDNRGGDLFVILTYPREITPDARFSVADRDCGRLFDHVVFVALKNGEHNGIGYFVDTGSTSDKRNEQFPLKDIPHRIMTALNVEEVQGLTSP